MKKLSRLIALVILISLSSNVLAATEPIINTIKEVIINGQTIKVNLVTVDMNNPNIELKVEMPNDSIGGDEELNSYIERKNMDAVINTNYFDSSNTLEPYGTIMKDSKIILMEGENAFIGIQDDGDVVFDRFKSVLKGSLDGKKQNEWNDEKQGFDYNIFDVWYVNSLPLDRTGAYMYTPERGKTVKAEGGIAVEVIDNKVSKILKNVQLIEIPSNGYVLYFATKCVDETFVDARFKVGKTIDFDIESTYTVDRPQPPKEPLTLYGAVDKTTENYIDEALNIRDLNIFKVWYINNKPVDSKGSYLFTPEKGDYLDVPIGKAIIVQDGIVINILYGAMGFRIPKNGFVIYFGKDAVDNKYIEDRFAIGKSVDFYDKDTKVINTEEIIKDAVEKYRYTLYQDIKPTKSFSEIDLNTVKDLISAGPYLVKNSEIILDAAKEGFKEAKIVNGKALRSAVGLTKDNQLLMITVNNVTLDELAKIMLKLGAQEAINLDGGGSSALYSKGEILTKPGRKLSGVLAVYDNSPDKILPIAQRIRNGEFKDIRRVKLMEPSIIDYTVNRFKDIEETKWYTKNVSYLVGMNIIDGYTDNTFRPNNNVNVDAFIKMVIESLGERVELGKGYWAQNYINKAVELGIVKENEFDSYKRPITRAEMARIIVRANNEVPEYDLEVLKGSVKDIDKLDQNLQEMILKAYGLGIITGYGDGIFKPQDTARRSEAAAVIIRMIDEDSRIKPTIQ